ncbi:hypothetical protein [Algoriphagus confluentis]|uniref:Alkyl hydroperoxide reductase subunit C/ Thiol specific antioxidant domain-containing protein n=1 Tax=Algoriphagus confluentis TaxID=1697556 RepID=A0ABQ6PKJ7_9BACT|nr:hypothetical protein Aconfl_08140 [Algoriphagus confluentis]
MKIQLFAISLLLFLISPFRENRSDTIQLVITSMELYLNGEKTDAEQFEIGNSYKVICLQSSDRFSKSDIVSDFTQLILQMKNSSRFDFLVYVVGDSSISPRLSSKEGANEAIIPIFVDKEKMFMKANPFLEGNESSFFLLDKDNQIIFSADSLSRDFQEFVLGIDSNLPKIIDSKLDYQIRF